MQFENGEVFSLCVSVAVDVMPVPTATLGTLSVHVLPVIFAGPSGRIPSGSSQPALENTSTRGVGELTVPVIVVVA